MDRTVFACGLFALLISTSAVVQAQTTVYADQFGSGFNAADSTDALQGAINSGASTVIVRDMGSDWIVNKPLQAASNQKIIFESGVTLAAKRGINPATNKYYFAGIEDSLFNISAKSNVTLEGYGAAFKMWKQDYQDASKYEAAQWRHTINVSASSNVTIKGLTLRDSGGDGLYLGKGGKVPVTGAVIQDVVADNHHRQGISITNAKDVLVEGSTFSNTSGTSPQAGMDFEPNNPTNELTNIVVRNSRFLNNAAAGLMMYQNEKMTATASPPISLLIEDSEISGQDGLWLGMGGDTAPLGTMTFRNVTVKDTNGAGLRILWKNRSTIDLVFDGLILDNVSNFAPYPIELGRTSEVEHRFTPEPGGIDFFNVQVIDDMDRAVIGMTDDLWTRGLWDVHGQIYVDNPYGAWGDLGPSTNHHDVDLQIISGIVPEPAGLGLVAVAALLLKRRRINLGKKGL